MREGGALVEVLPWNFHGKGCGWADQYFKDWFDVDHSVNTGYFRQGQGKRQVAVVLLCWQCTAHMLAWHGGGTFLV